MQIHYGIIHAKLDLFTASGQSNYEIESRVNLMFCIILINCSMFRCFVVATEIVVKVTTDNGIYKTTHSKTSTE